MTLRVPPPLRPAMLCLLLFSATAGMGSLALHPLLEDSRPLAEILLWQGAVPRLVSAVICGYVLGLSGALFQHILRNRLASPDTVGAAGGAQLALALALLFAPGLLTEGRFAVAFAGSAAAVAAVLALSWRRRLDPMPLILSGLIITLYTGAVSAALILVNDGYLASLFLWGSGSLVQTDWSLPQTLTPLVAVCGLLAWALLRPLSLLDLGDDAARSLGVPLTLIRLAALTLAVTLSAAVVAKAGVLGFVGLAGPALAYVSGARTLRQSLLWSPLLATGLLALTDQSVAVAGRFVPDLLPTGAATAVFGAPLILMLVRTLRSHPAQITAPGTPARSRLPTRHPGRWLLALGGITLLLGLTALTVGRGAEGWTLALGDDFSDLLPWRLPRVLAAAAAGLMLALAGTMLQRLTGNPLAGPEVLGVTSGAAMGMLISLYAFPAATGGTSTGFAALGALGVLLALLWLNRRDGGSTDRILLAGIAVGALFDALTSILTADGDPRAVALLNWTMGSTYRVDMPDALLTGGIALALAAVTPLCIRWLDLLPLGPEGARSLGLNLQAVRLRLLVLTAALSAAATLVIGPLSFIGLMAPHLARLPGLLSARTQLAGAALSGAGLMLAADWISRVAVFPFQIPAGLTATLIGAPLVLLLISRE